MVKNAKRRSTALYHRLMKLKPDDMSNNQWTKAVGLSTSFFTNLKNGSAPSVWHLEAALEVVGVTLGDFFITEPPQGWISVHSWVYPDRADVAIFMDDEEDIILRGRAKGYSLAIANATLASR